MDAEQLKAKLRAKERHLTILENGDISYVHPNENDTRKWLEQEISKLRQELDKCLRKNT
jgi:hypothetical protein